MNSTFLFQTGSEISFVFKHSISLVDFEELPSDCSLMREPEVDSRYAQKINYRKGDCSFMVTVHAVVVSIRFRSGKAESQHVPRETMGVRLHR